MPTIDITQAPYNASPSDTDSLPAINAAIAALGSSGGEILLPYIFPVSAPVVLPDIGGGYSGVRLRGTGRRTGLRPSAEFSGGALIIIQGGCASVMSMDLPCASISPRGIWHQSPSQGLRCKYKDVHVTLATIEAFRAQGPGDYLIDDFYTNSCALAIRHAGDAKNSLITGLYAIGGDGVVFSSELGSCEGVTLTNSHILPTGGHGCAYGGVGVVVLGANAIQIANSWIDCCKEMAVYAPPSSNNRAVKLMNLWLASDTGKSVYWEAGMDLAIDHVQCENAKPNVAQISMPVGELGRLNGVTITNSVFSDVLNIGNVGVYASRVRGLSITGNRFRNRGTSIAESNGVDNLIADNLWTVSPATISPSTLVTDNRMVA